MIDVFDAALDRLYEVFAAPAPERVTGCFHCCISYEEAEVLVSKPLRDLTSKELGRYATSVFQTVGGPMDFRYLLPRIFEIAASDPDWLPSPEMAIGKLRLADWSEWTEVERQAVIDFLSAWFDKAAVGGEQDPDAWLYGEMEALVCGLARADLAITPYLERLTRPEYAKGLVNLIRDYRILYRDRDLSDSFWADAKDAAPVFKAFMEARL